MSKIACDICGSTYDETATHCPICGSARPVDAEAVDAAAATGSYTYVKGGRFSKSNVRKRNRGKTVATVTPKAVKEREIPEETEETEEKSEGGVRGLIITAAVLLVAVLVVVGYIAYRYFNPSESDGPQHITETVSCTSVSVETSEYLLKKGDETVQLSVRVKPNNTTDKILFESLNPDIATVDANGLVTAIAPGEAKIKITCGNQETVVTITSKVGEPEIVINLGRTAIEFNSEDETYEFFTKQLCNIDAKDITWSTDDPDVVVVDDGVVTVVGEGVTYIRAEYMDVKAACQITVVFKNETENGGGIGEDGGNGNGIGEDGGNTGNGVGEDGGNTAPSGSIGIYVSWDLNNKLTEFTIKPGNQLTLYVKDSNGNIVDATFSVEDTDVCTMEGNVVTGVKAYPYYYTKIIATYNGMSAECVVRCNQ